MNKITNCLWFDNNADDAAEFYCQVFKDSKIIGKNYYGEGAPLPAGTLLTVNFEINGQEFIALNGGPMVKLSEAVSFVINCDTQEEIDYYWEMLTADGGMAQNCGWLKDKFGLSWQVCPADIGKYFDSGDKARAQRVMDALMPMYKLDIATLEKAYRGE